MSSIKEKERFKEQQEKFQAVLSALLKDEDNKYCVDCDAKGPRWAAWNLGVFLCIRCAGIHRNLGVHISKVKSVNLDSWTPEQVAMMQEMGNSRARAVYEANIPDGFRRPQTDSSLEAFIRSKYEQKKYIAREWIPPQPRVPKEWLEDPKAEKKRARAKQASSTIQLTNVPKTTNKPVSPAEETAKPAQAQKVEVKAPAANSASSDLLGLEAAAPVQPSGGNELLDLFVAPQSGQAPANTAPAPAAGSDLMNGATDGGLFGEEKGEEKKTSAKDSIMALYGGGGGGGGGVSQPQMYGVPGLGAYMYEYQPYAAQPNMPGSNLNPAVSMNGSEDLMKLRDNNPFMMPPQPFAQAVPNSSMPFSQSQFMAHPSFSQSNPAFNSAASQHPAFSQPSASFATLTNQQPSISQSVGLFGDLSSQMARAASTKAGQFPVFSQSTVNGFHQKTAPIVSTSQAPSSFATFASPSTQSQSFLGAPGPLMEAQGLGQSRGPNPSWGLFNQPQASCYGNQGGVYMPQAQQQMYPGMTGQQQGMMGPQGMMGAQGMRPQQGMVGAQQGMVGQQQGMVGQQHGMVGQQQGMMGTQQGMMGMMGQPQGMMGQPQGMMGQPQGMMGNQGMNGAQMGMYNGQMMSGNPGMYAPQQMQQLQFQQMQQQMTNLKLNGAQMGTMPQQTTSGASGWGNTGQGQTLATNLWQ